MSLSQDLKTINEATCHFSFVIFYCYSLNGQDATARIHGKISGTDRQTFAGVSIGVAGTSLGVISDEHWRAFHYRSI